MSLISLASVRALQEDAVAEGLARPGRIPDAADAQERIIGQLVAFIPAEPVALFIAVLAAVGRRAAPGCAGRCSGSSPGSLRSGSRSTISRRRALAARASRCRCSRWSRGWSRLRPGRPTVPNSPWNELGNFTPRWGLLVALVTAGGLLTVSELREALLRGRPRRARPALR